MPHLILTRSGANVIRHRHITKRWSECIFICCWHNQVRLYRKSFDDEIKKVMRKNIVQSGLTNHSLEPFAILTQYQHLSKATQSINHGVHHQALFSRNRNAILLCFGGRTSRTGTFTKNRSPLLVSIKSPLKHSNSTHLILFLPPGRTHLVHWHMGAPVGTVAPPTRINSHTVRASLPSRTVDAIMDISNHHMRTSVYPTMIPTRNPPNAFRVPRTRMVKRIALVSKALRTANVRRVIINGRRSVLRIDKTRRTLKIRTQKIRTRKTRKTARIKVLVKFWEVATFSLLYERSFPCATSDLQINSIQFGATWLVNI